MSPEEKDFLIAEYNAAWAMVRSIDERRGTFARYYAILFGGSLSVVSAIFASQPSPSYAVTAALNLILITTAAAGGVIIYVLLSERSANIRYRQRANKIRQVFLSDSTDGKIEQYLNKEVHDPRGVGRTLPGIFFLIAIQIAVGLIFACGLWHFAKPAGSHTSIGMGPTENLASSLPRASSRQLRL